MLLLGFLEGDIPGKALTAVFDYQLYLSGIRILKMPHFPFRQAGFNRFDKSLFLEVVYFINGGSGFSG